MLSTGRVIFIARHKQIESKKKRKTYYKNIKHKRAGVATVISDKIDQGQEIFLETKRIFYNNRVNISRKYKDYK